MGAVWEEYSLEEMPILNILKPSPPYASEGTPPGCGGLLPQLSGPTRGEATGWRAGSHRDQLLFPKGFWSASKVTRGFPGGA